MSCTLALTLVAYGALPAQAMQAQAVDVLRHLCLPVQVGGLGLTLTAADRVIIVDPAWNPSIDNQSVDRAYRMGQTRDVVGMQGTARELLGDLG